MVFNHCIICDSIIKRNSVTCVFCSEKLKKCKLDNIFKTCKICGYPLLSNIYKCTECQKRSNNYILSMYDYRNSFVRELLVNYKFNYKIEYSRLFASIITKYIEDFDYVIPIPSSSKSLLKRGWDQMYEICKHLDKDKVRCVLVNNSNGPEQKELNREERLHAAENNYKLVDCSISKDSKILVIDDVTTTGATMINAINLLKENGFHNVFGFTYFVQF